jgi:hypothetical protein
MDVCLVQCLCYQVEVSATGRSLVQRSPTDCGVCLSCDQVKINSLDTCCEQVGRRGKDCEEDGAANRSGKPRRITVLTTNSTYPHTSLRDGEKWLAYGSHYDSSQSYQNPQDRRNRRIDNCNGRGGPEAKVVSLHQTSSGEGGGGVKRLVHAADNSPHLMPRLRMNAVIPPLPYTPLWTIQKQL